MKLLKYLTLFSVVCMAQQLLAPVPNRGARGAKPVAKAPVAPAPAPVVPAPAPVAPKPEPVVPVQKTAVEIATKYSPEEIAGAAIELVKASGVKSADARNPRVRELLGDLVEAGLA